MRFASSVAICLALFACQADKPTEENPIHTALTGPTMGTSWSVVLVGDIPDTQQETLTLAIAAELARINGLMSTYDPNSELSTFNKMQVVSAVPMHSDVLSVVNAAKQISEQTNGAYDVTLGPVIRLWGFGADASESDGPAAELVESTLDYVGYKQLMVDDEGFLAKQHPQLEVDLSSIAKGYAVDQIGALVAAEGYDNYTVEIGGELLTRGHRGNNAPWRIGIELPDQTVNSGIEVNDSHIASSGHYRNYREVNGQRLSHIIDGSTGYPVRHNTAAVTVMHTNTMLADAWATALLVLDYDRARTLAEKNGISAQFTLKTDTGFGIERTAGFPTPIP